MRGGFRGVCRPEVLRRMVGSQICAWGDYIAGWEDREEAIRLEARLISERLPALCGKLWNLDGENRG